MRLADLVGEVVVAFEQCQRLPRVLVGGIVGPALREQGARTGKAGFELGRDEGFVGLTPAGAGRQASHANYSWDRVSG